LQNDKAGKTWEIPDAAGTIAKSPEIIFKTLFGKFFARFFLKKPEKFSTCFGLPDPIAPGFLNSGKIFFIPFEIEISPGGLLQDSNDKPYHKLRNPGTRN
jgi:hypothetical protein